MTLSKPAPFQFKQQCLQLSLFLISACFWNGQDFSSESQCCCIKNDSKLVTLYVSSLYPMSDTNNSNSAAQQKDLTKLCEFFTMAWSKSSMEPLKRSSVSIVYVLTVPTEHPKEYFRPYGLKSWGHLSQANQQLNFYITFISEHLRSMFRL